MTKTEEDVQAFLNMLATWAPVPTCIFSSDREKIVLEWEGEGKKVSVSFAGDGGYSHYYVSRAKDIAGPFFGRIREGLPEGFVLMITSGLELGDLSEWK